MSAPNPAATAIPEALYAVRKMLPAFSLYPKAKESNRKPVISSTYVDRTSTPL